MLATRGRRRISSLFPARSFFLSSLPTANLSEALLDPDVDHKTAAGHALAITAMARMNDQRTVRKLVADSTA